MPLNLTEAEREGLTPAEIEALTGAGAEDALNFTADGVSTPKGEPAEELATPEEIAANEAALAAEGSTAAPAPAPAPAAEGLSAEDLALLAESNPEQATPTPAPAPKVFEVSTEDYDAQLAAIEAKRTDVEKRWSEGELSDEDRIKALAEAQAEANKVMRDQIRAETLAEINRQNAADAAARAEQAMNDATMALIKSAADAKTIDYLKDEAAQKQFDMALQMLGADPAFAQKTAADQVAEAHKAVLAVRGLAQAPAPSPAPAAAPAAPAAPKPRDVPVTLAGLPAAAPVGVQDATMERLAGLTGDAYDRAFAALPQAEQDRVLGLSDRM